MSRRKKPKLAEIKIMPNVFEDPTGKKGNWNSNYFKNNNPIVLELGCGKGEYTTNLAQKFLEKNFIGIDIKGARIWKGAKISLQNEIKNVGFLKILIEKIEDHFEENEVSEIWIPFPDPYPKPSKFKKRLISPKYLNYYKNILQTKGFIHFKTDNDGLYEYAMETLKSEGHNIIEYTNNLYQSNITNEFNTIRTYYENKFLEEGKTIKYIKFQLRK